MSIQVNVDRRGANIPGDAANEPSLAVDPRDPSRIAIGWRQFDSVTSDFRQAGWGYTTSGGKSWSFPGVLDPGAFRSDPVLEADADGVFYYNSLRVTGSLTCDVFRSFDGGATWEAPVFAFGGDKPWMAIDRTSGIGRGNLYCAWSPLTGTKTFNRSIDGGASFSVPSSIPGLPQYGTLAVGTEGELYVAGVDPSDFRTFLVTRSTNAGDPRGEPSFDLLTRVDLGGSFAPNDPNPGGLPGQAWIAVDHSTGPTRGWVYLLCSVDPPGSDPCDVRFARSTDGGKTWSRSIRINQDPLGAAHWQWFGMLGCSPGGRLDVLWNDTTRSDRANLAELTYSVSYDGGAQWTPGVPVSPMWNSYVGWPTQPKIGDYYDIESDVDAVHVAYAATFNGEQDVYYLRIEK